MTPPGYELLALARHCLVAALSALCGQGTAAGEGG